MTPRETILQALFAQLQTIAHARVLRNEVLPEVIPSGGLIILRDGDAGEPETMLSPLSYYWQHRATLDVAVQKGDAAERDASLDLLFENIATALAANKTLGGLCDLVTPLAPEIGTLGISQAPSVKIAIVPVELVYVTGDQLG